MRGVAKYRQRLGGIFEAQGESEKALKAYEEAFRVQCGVPSSMTMTDVYNGLLKVDIAIAPVRPAEFVVFTVSQLVQQQTS